MTRIVGRWVLGATAAGMAIIGLVFVGTNGDAIAAQPAAAPTAPNGGTTASPPMPMPMPMPMNMAIPTDSIGKYDVKNESDAMFFGTVLRGSNEAPSKMQPAGGDKNGSGTSLVRVQANQVSYAFTWTGIGAPTEGHIHQGNAGVNGAVKIPFFGTKLPDGRTSVVGTVTVNDPDLLANIKGHPEQFYVNLHTADFPDGAVRGQLHAMPVQLNLQKAINQDQNHPVVEGDQIYSCTRQESDGSFKFTPVNVDTVLTGGIRHTYVKPGPGGSPQWIAPDNSAVTGKAVDTIYNGANNVPELVLAATQSGAPDGQLSSTHAILRLDTIGGVAPAGTCDPTTQAVTAVPYSADYLFINS